jgi:uncharacterized membrane protein YgdD (TMEM256/DUF423 family)
MDAKSSAVLCMVLGAFSAACSVALSAVVAHLPGVTASDLNALHSALQIQQFHAVALILLGLVFLHTGPSRLLLVTGFLFVSGTLLFSGNIYLRVLTGITAFRQLVPYAGGALILAWLTLGLGLFFSRLNPLLSADAQSTSPKQANPRPPRQTPQ